MSLFDDIAVHLTCGRTLHAKAREALLLWAGVLTISERAFGTGKA